MFKVNNQKYINTIYNLESAEQNEIYIEYDGQEIENASDVLESIKWTRRILDNGSKVFSLDNFVSQTVEMIIHDVEITDLSKEFYIKIITDVDGEKVEVPLGYFLIKDNPTKVNGKTTFKLTDRSVLFDKKVDVEPYIKENGGMVTKLQLVQEFCRQCGVEFGNTSFVGSSEFVGVYDNTINARVHISYLAEQSGSIATIDRDGKLYFKQIKTTNDTHILPEEIISNQISISNKYKISKVLFDSYLIPFQIGNDTNDTLFINSNNMYISSQSNIDNIYNIVNHFEVSSFTTGNILGNPTIDPWDFIQITLTDENENEIGTYKTLAQYTLTYNGNFLQNFSTTIDNQSKNTNTTYSQDTAKYKKIESKVDNANAQYELIASEVYDEKGESKITQLTIGLEDVKSQIGTSSDVTTTVEGYGSIKLENVLASEIIYLNIHPLNEDIDYLITNEVIVGQNTILKAPVLYFDKDLSKEVPTKYTLPKPLYFFDKDTYDEYIIDNEKSKRYIIKRVGKDENGNKYKLDVSYEDTLTFETYSFPETGTYNLSFKGMPTAYIKARVIISNIYTSQYATTVELNSKVEQTNKSFEVKLGEKLDGKEFTGANMILAINNDESQFKLKSDKISLEGKKFDLSADDISIESENFNVTSDGKITAKSGDIGGFGLQQNKFTKKVKGIYNYNGFDASIISSILIDLLYKNSSLKKVLDANGDGQLMSNDALIISKILNGTKENTHEVECTFNINSDDPKCCITVETGNETAVSIGAGGINSNMIASNNAVITTSTSSTSPDGIIMNGENKEINIYDYGNQGTKITPTLVQSQTITQTSLEEKKKNFEKLQSGLDIIQDVDIYKYHYKTEDDGNKKHIGFVIGEDYKYSQEITSNENDSVDLYSMVSVCMKAIQEQQTIINDLKEEVQRLKENK